jgi:RNA polymerase sigma factor (sigma-70 family)
MTSPATGQVSMLHDATDADLVRRCLAGDEQSWAFVIDKYKNLIYSIPIKYGLSQDQAAEVFQATCVELLIRLPELRQPQALAAWLIRIAVTKTRERHTELARVAPIEDADNRAVAVPGGMVQEDLIHQVEQEQIVRRAVAGLSQRCRRLVAMLFYESPVAPYAEVAAQLGLATGSIGFIRARCFRKLRARLEELGLQ